MAEERRVERRSEWKFLITSGGWRWSVKRPDGTEEQSKRAFETLKDCADEATTHGYGAWKYEERRHVDVRPLSRL